MKPFIDPLLPYEHLSRPLVKERGLWTWGHVIFDYRRYLDNMARLKMNKVTVWNDFAPINGREFVDYAHSLGIKVIWGYSWIWDEKPEEVVTDPAARKVWKEKIVTEYADHYAHLGGTVSISRPLPRRAWRPLRVATVQNAPWSGSTR